MEIKVDKEKEIRAKPIRKNIIFFNLNPIFSVLSLKRYFIGIQKHGINISQAVIPKSQ